MSSSLIAEAIQSASRWETSPESAVTSPPPPRRTVRLPSSSRSNWAGPRLETMIRGALGIRAKVTGGGKGPGPGRRGSGVESDQEVEPVAQEARREELAAGVLLARAAEA